MKRIKNRWKALDEDLKNYFCGRALLLIAFLALTAASYVFVHTKSLAMLLAVIFLCYGAWILYQFTEAMTGNVFVYEGVCVKKNERKLDVGFAKKTTPLYGRTTAVIRVKDDGPDSEDGFANVIIPVGFSYDLQKGYLVKAYASRHGLIMKNKNTFSLPNPILIRVAKTSYEDDAEND